MKWYMCTKSIGVGNDVDGWSQYEAGMIYSPSSATIDALPERFRPATTEEMAEAALNEVMKTQTSKHSEVFIVVGDGVTGSLHDSMEAAIMLTNYHSRAKSICKLTIRNGEIISHKTVYKY